MRRLIGYENAATQIGCFELNQRVHPPARIPEADLLPRMSQKEMGQLMGQITGLTARSVEIIVHDKPRTRLGMQQHGREVT